MVLTDSQGDYGGMAQYVRWAGPLTETVRDFYASKRIRVGILVLVVRPLSPISWYRAVQQTHVIAIWPAVG